MGSSRDAQRSFVRSPRCRRLSRPTDALLLPLLLAALLFVVEPRAALSAKLLPPSAPRWFYNGTHASPLCEATSRCDTSSDERVEPACSCHPNCSLYDACCEDVRPRDWRRQALPQDAYECAVYPRLGADSNGDLKTVTAAAFVFLITKCPSEYAGSCLARLCDSPTSNVSDDKLRLTWVTDQLTGLTYKNKFCAVCHGLSEEQMAFWSLSYGCIKDPAMARFGLTGCIHHVLLSTDAIASDLPRCFGPYYSHCPNGSSQQLHEACTDSPARFFYDRDRFLTYRNYNCSLCYSSSSNSYCSPNVVNFALPLTIDSTLVSGSCGCLRERVACDANEERRFIQEICIATDLTTNGLMKSTNGMPNASSDAQIGCTFQPVFSLVSGSDRLRHEALLVYLLLTMAFAAL